MKGVEEEVAGLPGSIRIDVLDKKDRSNLVCVYDIKTGRRGLSGPRIDEIERNVTKAYGKKTRFIITEMRPQVIRP